VRCFGFAVQEAGTPGAVDVAAARRLGLPPGPAYRALKVGAPL
jgi:hypothetical protein